MNPYRRIILMVAAAANERGEPTATDRQRAMNWAQRLRRAFAIETCRQRHRQHRGAGGH